MPTKKQVLAAVAAGVALGGVYLILKKLRAQNDDEDLFKRQERAARHVETAPTEEGMGMGQPSATVQYSFAANEFNEKMIEEALAEQEKHVKGKRPVEVRGKSDDAVVFENLGVSFVPQPGWLAREEISPMPNVAMISVTKPEFQEQAGEGMGDVPVVMLTVEDISSENLTLEEYKEKSKSMALTQMMMMTGGMMQPQLSFDDKLDVGPFKHCLEYGINHPQFAISVCNVLGCRSGMAYVFQLMANPSIVARYKSEFMQMARSAKFLDGIDGPLGVVRVTTGTHMVESNPSWVHDTSVTESGVVASFNTTSTMKQESLTIYEGPHPFRAAEFNVSNEAGVRIANVKDGARTLKTFGYGPFTAVLRPTMKNETDLGNEWPIRVVKSVKRDTAAPSLSFVNTTHGYQFVIAAGSMLVASKVGGGTVVYLPLGKPMDEASQEQSVTVTIRVGTPATDPDCSETLDAWEQRLQAEGPVNDLHREKRCGQDCLVFSTKEMQETGPGQRSEVQSKVHIFVRNQTTTLIRWEASTGIWRKHESKLNQMLESLKFL